MRSRFLSIWAYIRSFRVRHGGREAWGVAGCYGLPFTRAAKVGVGPSAQRAGGGERGTRASLTLLIDVARDAEMQKWWLGYQFIRHHWRLY